MACMYCGDTAGPFHLDHVVPRSRGGPDHPRNIVRACQRCNLSKGDKLPSEWRPHVPPEVRDIERRVSAIVAKRVSRKGKVDERPPPRLNCQVCGRDLFLNWSNAHLGWWYAYGTDQAHVVEAALYCTGECYREIDALVRRTHGGRVSLRDMRVDAAFGRWAWLELASVVNDCAIGRALLAKSIAILRQCSKVEPDEEPPFVATEGDDPTMVDD